MYLDQQSSLSIGNLRFIGQMNEWEDKGGNELVNLVLRALPHPLSLPAASSRSRLPVVADTLSLPDTLAPHCPDSLPFSLLPFLPLTPSRLPFTAPRISGCLKHQNKTHAEARTWAPMAGMSWPSWKAACWALAEMAPGLTHAAHRGAPLSVPPASQGGLLPPAPPSSSSEDPWLRILIPWPGPELGSWPDWLVWKSDQKAVLTHPEHLSSGDGAVALTPSLPQQQQRLSHLLQVGSKLGEPWKMPRRSGLIPPPGGGKGPPGAWLQQ